MPAAAPVAAAMSGAAAEAAESVAQSDKSGWRMCKRWRLERQRGGSLQPRSVGGCGKGAGKGAAGEVGQEGGGSSDGESGGGGGGLLVAAASIRTHAPIVKRAPEPQHAGAVGPVRGAGVDPQHAVGAARQAVAALHHVAVYVNGA